MELKELFNNVESVTINNLQKKAYSNTSKIEILNKLAVKLSDLTDLVTEIYLGHVSDGVSEYPLYMPINNRGNKVYFKNTWIFDLENNLDNKDSIFISNEGLRNLKFLIIKIDKTNTEQNEIFLKLSQMVDL